MKAVEKIRIGIGNYILRNKLNKSHRIRKTQNLEPAKSIDILFDASITANFNYIKTFVDDLTKQGKKVNALGYVNSKTIPQQYYLINLFDFFSKQDLNFFNIPVSKKVNNFIYRETDMLINLCLPEVFCIDYISSLKKATFKIGKYTNELSNLDMMIDIKKTNTCEYLIQQIVHYLTLIKSKEAYING